MPMIDYLCQLCGFHTDHYYKSSQEPEDILSCEAGTDCTGLMWVTTDPQYVFSMPAVDAQRFPAVLIHQNISTGEFSFPGRNDDPTPPGFRPISITNMREADKWTKEINSRELSRVMQDRQNNKEYFEERTKERRERVESELRRTGASGRVLALYEKAKAFADAKHARNFSSARALNPNFHIQALSFDSSNRNPYSGPETDYRQRKT